MAAGSRFVDRPEAARARHHHVDDRAGRCVERALARQVARGAVGRRRGHHGRRSGLAAEQAERRRGHALHAQRAGRVRAVQHAPHAARTAAAAILSGSAGVGIDLVALHAHGKRHLQHFDRRVHGVGDAAGDGVDAVLVGPRAEAALDGLVGDVAAAASADRAPPSVRMADVPWLQAITWLGQKLASAPITMSATRCEISWLA